MRINISSNTWNGYTAENQEERLFFNETAFLFWCHALWKLGSSNCCIFEMKHAMGLKTCTKINFLIIFNLVLIRIRKPRYFDFSLLMTSLWKPSIACSRLSDWNRLRQVHAIFVARTKNLHGSVFRSRGTVQVFEQQTALQSITGFARLFKQVAQVKNSSIQKFVRTRVIGVFDIRFSLQQKD